MATVMETGFEIKLAWLLAIISGVLAALSFPGFELDLLVWIALVPLFFALENAHYKRSFSLSFLAGFAFFAILLYWIFTLEEWAGPFIVPAYLLLIIYLSLYWGAFGLLYSFFRKRLGPLQMIFVASALWIFLEFIRAIGKFGFTWGDLAYSLYQRPMLIQISSITGAWGISFLIVLTNYLVFLTIKRRNYGYLLGALAILGLVFSWGMLQMREEINNDKELKLAIVQTNVEQRVKTEESNIEMLQQEYQKLLNSIDQEVDLVILPESILPGYILRQAELLEPFANFARTNNTYLLLGTIDWREGKAYNATALLSKEGQVIAQYDKVQLVPFSPEYFPFIDFLTRSGWIEKLAGNIAERLTLGYLAAGSGYNVMRSELGNIGTPICFESTFSGISREFVRRGAQLLITVTNDGWFKGSFALPQHFAFGVFRAVENHRYFLQAANTGISGVISPQGKIIKRGGVAREEILYGKVFLKDEQTIYSKYGDWLIYAVLVYLLAASFRAGMGAHKRA